MDFVLALIGVLIISRSFLQAVSPFPLRRRMHLSLFWVALATLSEFTIRHVIARVPLEQVLESYDVTSGGLWPLVLLSLAAAPFIWGSRAHERSSR